MEPYYYNQMNKTQQAAYRAMKAGLTAMETSFPVPRLEGKELSDVFLKLRLDCPEIFYAVTFRYRFYPDSSAVEMIPEYLFEKSKIKEHQKALQARAQKLTRPVSEKSEWEKECYIHDFICQNVRYDKLKKPYSHEIIGPLGQGVGVCEGIAKTVKFLCDLLGIWCIVVLSDANPEKQIKYRHAWNIVRIGGVCCHLDATFDSTLSTDNILRYDYFNLDDKQLFRDHEPLLYPAVGCPDGNRFYYKEKKLSFTKLEDVEKRAAQAIRKGKILLFHWRGGYLTKEVLAEMLDRLEETAREKGRFLQVKINWPQAVLQIAFPEENTGERLTVEEANEGEKTA